LITSDFSGFFCNYAALLTMPILRLKQDFLNQQDEKAMGYLSYDKRTPDAVGKPQTGSAVVLLST